METPDITRVTKMNSELLLGSFCSGIEPMPNGKFLWSDEDYGETGVFWNHALLTNKSDINVPELASSIRSFYNNKGKPPAVYIPKQDLTETQLESQFQKEGFEPSFTDVWMKYTADSVTRPDLDNASVTIVTTQDELQTFIDLFYKVHAPDLDDPYAGLSDTYGDRFIKEFTTPNKNVTWEYILIQNGDTPVGHAALAYTNSFCCLYALGIVPEYREQGYGSFALKKQIERARDNNFTDIWLQTEAESKNEHFFSKRGFDPQFYGQCLVQRD